MVSFLCGRNQGFNTFVVTGIFCMLCLQFLMITVMMNGRNERSLSSAEHDKQPSFREIPIVQLLKESFKQSANRTTSTILATTLKPTSKTETKAHVIDMENDFYPYVDFNFVWPEVKPNLTGKRDFFMIILVNSAARGAKYRARRDGIRKTWANSQNCENLKTKRPWILVFSLGKAYDEKEDKANVVEANKHNDILIGDFSDNYLNNVVKTYMSQVWASALNAQYTLKTDDDVYIRLPLVMDWLTLQRFPKQFYGGAPYFNFNVDRDPKGKWAISKPYFNETRFPPFCAGAFFAISTDVLPLFFNYVRTRRPFHTDDAYFGIAARDLHINVTRIPGLLLEDNMPQMIPTFTNCYLFKARGFGHSVEPNLMDTLYGKYNAMCKNPPRC